MGKKSPEDEQAGFAELDTVLRVYFTPAQEPSLQLQLQLRSRMATLAQPSATRISWLLVALALLISLGVVSVVWLFQGITLLVLGYATFSIFAAISSIILIIACQYLQAKGGYTYAVSRN